MQDVPKDVLAEELFETVCGLAHRMVAENPTVFVGDQHTEDDYDDLLTRLIQKLGEYMRLPNP